MKYKNLNRLLVSILTILLFNCNNKKQIPSINIGMVTFAGYAPLYLAKEKNFFEGIEVNLLRIEDIGNLRAAMVANKLDIYAATFDIFQANETNEIPGNIFLILDESKGADAIIANKEIKNIESLKSKKVAAEKGFPPHFLLMYLLHKKNIHIKDLDFKDLTTQNAQTAFIGNNVDAAGIYEPYLLNALKNKKGSHILTSSKDFPGLISDVLVASDNILKTHPEYLEMLASGWFKAVDYILKNPTESYQIMGKYFHINAAEMEALNNTIYWYTLNDNKNKFFTKNKNIYTIFEEVTQVLEENNMIKKKYTPIEKITPSIIQNILKKK